MAFLRRAEGDEWPDVSDAALADGATQWLAPFVAGARSLAEIGDEKLSAALDALLPWDMRRRLDAEAPTHFPAPAGSQIAIDYESGDEPAIHVRVQELYGLKSHPTLAGGRVKPVLHLLSPAHRPIQTTGDLARFWAGAWSRCEEGHEGPPSPACLARRSGERRARRRAPSRAEREASGRSGCCVLGSAEVFRFRQSERDDPEDSLCPQVTPAARTASRCSAVSIRFRDVRSPRLCEHRRGGDDLRALRCFRARR